MALLDGKQLRDETLGLVKLKKEAGQGSITFGTGSMIGLTDAPILGTDIVNKTYVDNISAGLDPKEAVKLATTADLGATYVPNGGAVSKGQFTSVPSTLDDETVSIGDRILVKNQTDEKENGIYVVTASGTWERSTDHDATPSNEVSTGNFVFVTNGTVGKTTGWILTNSTISGNLTLNTDNLTWVQMSSSTQFVEGKGIVFNGNKIETDIADETLTFDVVGDSGKLQVNLATPNATEIGIEGSAGLVIKKSDISGAITSSNGLTKTVDGDGNTDIKLGGTLTEDTNLALSTFDLNMNGGLTDLNISNSGILSDSGLSVAEGSKILFTTETKKSDGTAYSSGSYLEGNATSLDLVNGTTKVQLDSNFTVDVDGKTNNIVTSANNINMALATGNSNLNITPDTLSYFNVINGGEITSLVIDPGAFTIVQSNGKMSFDTALTLSNPSFHQFLYVSEALFTYNTPTSGGGSMTLRDTHLNIEVVNGSIDLNGTIFEVNTNDSQFYVSDEIKWGNSTTNSLFLVDDDKIRLEVNTNEGIVYSSTSGGGHGAFDYISTPSSFNDLSLITKKYVDDAITAIPSVTVPSEVVSDKNQIASVTSSDGDTTGVSIVSEPQGYVQVMVNGMQQALGDGVKTTDCYFSADSGTTAKAISAIVASDTLYWNGTIAGFELVAADRVDLNYSA